MPPRIASEDAIRRTVIPSPTTNAAPSAVITGTLNCTDAPCVGVRPGIAAYQIVRPSPTIVPKTPNKISPDTLSLALNITTTTHKVVGHRKKFAKIAGCRTEDPPRRDQEGNPRAPQTCYDHPIRPRRRRRRTAQRRQSTRRSRSRGIGLAFGARLARDPSQPSSPGPPRKEEALQLPLAAKCTRKKMQRRTRKRHCSAPCAVHLATSFDYEDHMTKA